MFLNALHCHSSFKRHLTPQLSFLNFKRQKVERTRKPQTCTDHKLLHPEFSCDQYNSTCIYKHKFIVLVLVRRSLHIGHMVQ